MTIEDMSEIMPAMMVKPEQTPIKLNPDGSMFLGAANTASMVRMMEFYQSMLKRGEKAPLGVFSKMVAERITNKTSKYDCLVGIFGPRGNGKSRSALYICTAVASRLSAITGLPPERFFTGSNIVTLLGGAEFSKKLSDVPDMSCVICDDAGVSAGNREALTRQNRNTMKIIQTCRNKRLFVVFTAINPQMIDLQLRVMLLCQLRVHRSAHAHGYNVLKINAVNQNTIGKTFYARLNSEAGKVDYFICPNAPDDVVAAYDKERDESARVLADQLTGGGKPAEKEKAPDMRVMRGQDTRERQYELYGDAAREILTKNPKLPKSKLAEMLDVNLVTAGRLKERVLKEVQNGTKDIA